MTKPSGRPPDGDGGANVAVRIHATIRMTIPARKRKEAQGILGSMIERIKLEDGCLSCCLYQDAMEGNTLMFEEIWAGESYLQKHLLSDEFRNVLLVVEMASASPEIRFDRVSNSTGISTIEKARGESDARRNESGPSPL